MQIAGFLKRNPDARLDAIRPEEVPGLEEAIDENGALRTRPDMWSEVGGIDGFYIARIVRPAS